MNQKYIGYSLSFCVRDILNGTRDINSVEKIVCGTLIGNLDAWKRVIESYLSMYWNNDPKAIVIAETLLFSGRLEQPRLRLMPAPNLSNGVWWEAC